MLAQEKEKKLKDLDILREYKYSGSWNRSKTYNADPVGSLQVCGLITGCGIAQMYGVTYLEYMDQKDRISIIEKIKEDWKKEVGGILCTLGQNYRASCEQIIKELGFEEIAEYPNYRHDRRGDETQKLYILKL